MEKEDNRFSEENQKGEYTVQTGYHKSLERLIGENQGLSVKYRQVTAKA